MKKEVIFLTIGIMSLLFSAGLIVYSKRVKQKTIYQKYDEIRYQKDSLEVELYKRQLESYPFDHSEIKDTTVKKQDKWQTKW